MMLHFSQNYFILRMMLWINSGLSNFSVSRGVPHLVRNNKNAIIYTTQNTIMSHCSSDTIHTHLIRCIAYGSHNDSQKASVIQVLTVKKLQKINHSEYELQSSERKLILKVYIRAKPKFVVLLVIINMQMLLILMKKTFKIDFYFLNGIYKILLHTKK